MILFVNGCVRADSRTYELAQAVLAELDGEKKEVRLYPDGPDGLTEQSLLLREEKAAKREYDHSLFDSAKQFAEAEVIVIAAPYWDLAFPAKVRAYFEAVTVSGITFCYGDHGIPQGLCKGKQLIYVMTAGGPVIKNFGFEYIKALAEDFYGIKDVRLVKAEGLDIWGADPAAILEMAKQEIPDMLNEKKE